MSIRWKIGTGVALAVVAANLGLRELDRLTRSPGGPSSSSFATAPDGVAAYAELLRRYDRPVARLRDAPAAAGLDPSATLVVLEPTGLSGDDSRAMRDFLEAGGRLVAGGRPDGWLRSAVPDVPEWEDRGGTTARGAFATGVRRVRTAGEGRWLGGGVLRLSDGSLVVRRVVGRGTALLLADPSPLQNRLLGEADNAALGLALAGNRPVAFAESVHGFGPARGIEAIPGRWWWVFAGLLLAALTLALARGRRLGPPEREHRKLPPARAEFAEAIATLLAKSRPRQAGVETARALVRRRLRVAPDAAVADVRAAAAAGGLGHAETEALVGGAADAELLALGRALRQLERKEAIAS